MVARAIIFKNRYQQIKLKEQAESMERLTNR
jgi:hypothetical protein